ncbi:MAG: trigger factor [Chloroflexi bacterium]|nr:trigger factor [Chloroflexota bacterium]
MKVTRDDAENGQAVLHIEVEEDRVERHLQRAHQKVSARVNIPGFRKGKAPRRLVEQFVGRDFLLDEAMETLVPEAVGVAVEESEIEGTHTPPHVDVIEREPVVKIDATVALPPKATLGDYSNLEFDDQLEEVTDEQVNEQIEQVRESQATWEPAGRASRMGDLLTISTRGLVDGRKFTNVESGDYLVESASKNPVPGFAERLKGLKEGDSSEFELPVPDDYPNEKFAGKTVQFTVDVSAVKKKELPKLNEALVASLGENFKSVAELRTRISENLEAQAKDGLRRSLEEKIVEALVEGAEFVISPMIIDHEAEHVLDDQQRQLAQYNIDFQRYLQGIGKSSEEIVAEAKDSAELRLKRSLVIDSLVETEEATVGDEDVAAEITVMRESPQYAKEDLDTDEARDAVRRILRRRSAMDRVIEQTHNSGATGRPRTKKSTTARAKKPAAAKTAAVTKPRNVARVKTPRRATRIDK